MRFSSKKIAAVALSFAFGSTAALSAPITPVLNFTDLVSGPDTGLGDGKGSGTIVTVWGQHLGSSQGESEIVVKDSSGTERTPHIYYWKIADGQLPGGPADLHSSHRMQEIAISIPDGNDGPVEIIVKTNDGISNALPFTVRAGSIYHTKPGGDNTNGDGSFNNPWEFSNGGAASNHFPKAPGNERLTKGSIVYSHGVQEPASSTSGIEYGFFLRALHGTASEQIAFATYPGTSSKIEAGMRGLKGYLSEAIVLSKYTVLVGYIDEPAPGAPYLPPDNTNSNFNIFTTSDGRYIGNYLAERTGKCANGYHGAITSNGMSGSNVKVYGNQIVDWGCDQTSHFAHTTYMSKRSADGSPATPAWEFGWNYLKDNKAKHGIHFYDESTASGQDCDDVTGTLSAHDNVIINQKGSGVSIRAVDTDGSAPCWTAGVDIYNNILVNVGLGPLAEPGNGTSPQGIIVGQGTSGDHRIFNNLIYGFSDADSRAHGTPIAISATFKPEAGSPNITITNNIVYSTEDQPFYNGDTPLGGQNIWHYTGGTASKALVPSWGQNQSTANPLINLTGLIFATDDNSPVNNNGVSALKNRDIYGYKRDVGNDIGPMIHTDFLKAPNPPSGITALQ